MKKIKEFLKINKVLFLVIPILVFAWNVTITELMNSDYVSMGEKSIILTILGVFTAWSLYRVYKGIQEVNK